MWLCVAPPTIVGVYIVDGYHYNPRRAYSASVTVLGGCVCLMPYFSDAVSVYKVSTASLQHGADLYKKGFSCKRFVQKLWRHLLTVTSYEGKYIPRPRYIPCPFPGGVRRVRTNPPPQQEKVRFCTRSS